MTRRSSLALLAVSALAAAIVLATLRPEAPSETPSTPQPAEPIAAVDGPAATDVELVAPDLGAERSAPAVPAPESTESAEHASAPPRRNDVAGWLREVLPDRYGALRDDELLALTDLDLRGASIADDDLRLLADLPNLQSLSLRGTPVTDAGLVHLRRLPHLESLVLRDTAVTADGVRDLPTTLKALHLCRARITAEDVCRLPSMPSLEKLKLNFLKLDDAAVATLNAFPALRHLEIDESTVTDEGLASLLALNPRLERIETRSSSVTEEGVQRLAALYPDCEIVWQNQQIPPELLGR